jgi:hypothetical protein
MGFRLLGMKMEGKCEWRAGNIVKFSEKAPDMTGHTDLLDRPALGCGSCVWSSCDTE